MASLACDNAGTSLPRIFLFGLELHPQLLNSLRRSLEFFLKEPLVRGGFVVLRFFLSQLMFRCRSFSFGLALCRLQEGCEGVPSRAIRSCPLQPTRLQGGCHLRECCSRTLQHRESTWVRLLEDSLESGSGRGRIHCGQKRAFLMIIDPTTATLKLA